MSLASACWGSFSHLFRTFEIVQCEFDPVLCSQTKLPSRQLSSWTSLFSFITINYHFYLFFVSLYTFFVCRYCHQRIISKRVRNKEKNCNILPVIFLLYALFVLSFNIYAYCHCNYERKRIEILYYYLNHSCNFV